MKPRSGKHRRLTVDQSRFSNLSTRYDVFLFATVCEDANGTQLSVLSALARIDVDPWEEAGRLAAMPRATAARTLISILDHACGKNDNLAEAQATAAHLVGLLPQSGGSGAIGMAPTDTAAGAIKSPLQSYWWVWVGLALAISVITPRPDAATNPTMAQMETNQPAPIAGATEPSIAGAAPIAKDNNPAARPAADLVPSPIAYSR